MINSDCSSEPSPGLFIEVLAEEGIQSCYTVKKHSILEKKREEAVVKILLKLITIGQKDTINKLYMWDTLIGEDITK